MTHEVTSHTVWTTHYKPGVLALSHASE